ncbi:hypothetical protein PRUB_a3370 [Pseudoalteromonas rubra]|uniref:FHA domain-containing protein n=1 Tax=Pseudoalteromonas rubra TaxID=43658 RepID=A0A8T0C2H8_9GAMM|nr:hypothetical protein PRUB_a3370 [Pseudoalteromonas rubra]
MSKNGIWLNSVRLKSNQDTQLSVGDCIRFSNLAQLEFKVICCAPPQDLLLPNVTEHDPIDTHIVLDGYHLFPTEGTPEIAMFFDISNCQWCVENLDTQQIKNLTDGDLVTIGGKHWRLSITAINESKATIPAKDIANQLEYEISLSQDEEQTNIIMSSPHGVIDLKERAHHYLTALLARYKANAYHARVPVDELAQGWVSIKALARDLGHSENHVNILVHRARQQIYQASGQMLPASCLFERKKGHIRFAGKHFTILKAGILEAQVGVD